MQSGEAWKASSACKVPSRRTPTRGIALRVLFIFSISLRVPARVLMFLIDKTNTMIVIWVT